MTWNATEADFPQDRCLPDLFEEQSPAPQPSLAL